MSVLITATAGFVKYPGTFFLQFFTGARPPWTRAAAGREAFI